MNIQNKIQNWNEVLLQGDTKVKKVVDQATGQIYFEVAQYKNDNSMACKVINLVKEKTGKDWRFTFLNIDKVIFTTKHEANLEEFIKDYRFDINTENFAYSQVTVKEFDAIKRSNALDKVKFSWQQKMGIKKRSNALDKVMARELPINTEALSHAHTSMSGLSMNRKNKTLVNEVNSQFQKSLDAELKKCGMEAASSIKASAHEPARADYRVELDDFQKELVAEFSKPEHKATVKVVKEKSLDRGR